MSGGKDAYVGKIEPDNEAPAVFALQAGDPGTYAYNLTVQYEDDYGLHARQETLQMTVLDNGSGNILLPALLIIGIGGIVAYWYFVRKKKGSRDA